MERELGFQGLLGFGRITITYLQSYRNCGRVEVFVRGRKDLAVGPYDTHTLAERRKKHPNMIPCCDRTKPKHRYATLATVLDTFDNSSRVSAVSQKTFHFDITGPQLLVLNHLPLSQDEFEARGGDKVKIMGITFC